MKPIPLCPKDICGYVGAYQDIKAHKCWHSGSLVPQIPVTVFKVHASILALLSSSGTLTSLQPTGFHSASSSFFITLLFLLFFFFFFSSSALLFLLLPSLSSIRCYSPFSQRHPWPWSDGRVRFIFFSALDSPDAMAVLSLYLQ